MAFMSVEEWRKKKEAGNTQGASKSSASTRSSAASPSSNVASYNSSGYMSVEEWRAKRTNKTAQGWADAASALLNDTQMYYSKWRKKDDPQYSDFQNRISNLLVQADGWRKQYSGDDEAISSIDYIVSALSEAKQYAFKNQEYYSQWDTEDDYNEYIAGMEEYEAKKNLDLDAAKKEIAELEAAFDDWMYGENAEEYDATDTNARKAYDQKVREWEKRIAQKKQFYNQAKYIQEGIALSGVADPNSEHYDRDFKNYTGYKSTEPDSVWDNLLHGEDAEYEYINNQNGYRNQLKQRHRSMGRGKAISDGETAFKERGLDRMTEDEIAIYNYYYAKEGKEKAQEYLSSIQEALNQRRAISVFKGVEDETFQEMVFGVEAGLDQFKSGISSLLNTEDAYIPQSAVQMASAMVREDLADAGPKLPGWMGGASLGQAGYDLVTTTANMAPSTMTSLAVSMVNPTAGAAVGAALMGGSAAGNAYQEALNAGYDKGQARAYSALVGGSEAGLQYLLGGISKLGGNLSGKAISKIMNGVDNAFARTAIQIAGNMVSEGFEEGLQEVLTPWFKNLTLYADEDINWTEVAYSSLLGALTAGFMEGPGTVSTEVNTYRTGKRLQRENITAQRLADIGKTLSADTVAYQLAGRVNENTGAYTLGRLFNEIDAEITERNIADIQKSLERKRVARKDAQVIARSFAEVVAGAEFTDMQKAAIEMNNVLSQTVQEVIINPNSTVNQRSNGYKEVLMALAKEKTSDNTSRTSKEAPGQKSTDTEGNLPGADKGASYEVSEDGKTHLVSDLSKDVTVKGIASIEDGKMMLQLEDGSSVAAEDVSFGNEGDAIIYSTVADMGVNAPTANILVNAYHPGSGVSASAYSLGIKEAYRYGQYNYPMEEVAKGAFASALTDYQRRTAYKLGKLFSGKQAAKEEATIRKAAGEKKSASKETGTVHFGRKGRTFDDVRETALKTMDQLSAALGVEFYVFESYVNEDGVRVYKDANGNEVKAPNGWYDPRDGSIHIDLNAGKDGKGTMLFTIAHELTHFIRQWSPAKFKVLANFLIEQYGQKGKSIDAMVEAQIAKAKRNGREISHDTAYEEVVADSMEAMLTDGNVVQMMADLKQQDKTLWQKIADWFKDLAEDLKKLVGAYKGIKPDSVEGKMVADMQGVIVILESLYADALAEAGDNYKAAGGQKNTTQEGGEKMQIREIGDSGRFYVQADRQVITGDDPTLWGKQVERYINEQIRKEQDIALPTSDGHILLLTARSAYKLTDRHLSSIEKKVEALLPDDEYALKGRVATHIDELIRVARFDGYEPDASGKHENDIGEDGFNYFSAYFRDADGKYYRVPFSAAINEQEETTYSIGKIRQRSFPASRGSSSKKEALKGGRKASKGIIYSSEAKSQEVKTAIQLAYEKALGKKLDGGELRSDRDSSGNLLTQEQQEYFCDSVVRDKDGRLLVMYHGTPNGGFTKFRSGTYFTQNPEYADVYQNPGASSISTKNGSKAPMTYKVYLDIKKPFDTRNARERNIFQREFYRKYGTGTPLADSGLPDWVDGMDLQEFIEEMEYDYDGLILDEGGVGGYGDEVKSRGISYVVFNSEQVKDVGNKRPTSDPDYRYSDRENATYAEIEEERRALYQREIELAERKREAESNPELLQAMEDFSNLFSEMRVLLPKRRAGTATQAELDRIEEIKVLREERLQRVASLQESLGLNAMAKEAEEIRETKETLRVASDEAWAREGAERENKAIEKAGVSAPEYFRKKALKAFRTTTNFNEAGYLLPDGKLLNFSGGERNHRYRDHREIGEIYEATNGTAALNRFLNDGNIRIMAESPGIDLAAGVEPTREQYAAIKKFVNVNGVKDRMFFIDFSDTEGRRAGNYSYEGNVNADRVVNDIKYYYENGKVREQSSVAQFRWSDRDQGAERVTKALQKENAKLKEDVKYLRELLKLQKSVTGGTKFTKTSVEAATGLLMKSANAKGNKAELAEILNGFYEYIAKGEELTWESVVEAAQPAVGWLQNHESTKKEMDSFAQDVLHEIRGSRIYLDETQKKEVAYKFGSYNDFRKKMMGTVTFTDKSSISLDSWWHEMSDRYPSVFDSNTNATDMPEVLMDTIGRLRSMEVEAYSFGYDQEMMAHDLMLQVYDSYWKVSTLRTVADVKQKEINELKGRHTQRIEKLRNEHREKTAQLRMEFQEDLKRVKQEYRTKSEERLQKVVEKHQQSRERIFDSHKKTAMRQKIRKVIRDLDKLLNHGDKKQNVKEGMKDFVAEALHSAEILFIDNYTNEDMVWDGVGTDLTPAEAKHLEEARAIMEQIDNLPSGSYESWMERQEAEQKLKSKLAYRMAQLKDVFVRERERLNRTQVSDVLSKLAEAYKALESAEQASVRDGFHENVYQFLQMLQSEVGGTIVKDMSLGQLESLYKAYTMVLTTVRNANRMFSENLKETRDALANRVMFEIKKSHGDIKKMTKGGKLLNSFSWNNLKPVYAFQRIGSKTMTTLFGNIRKGQDTWARDIQEADEFRRKINKKYDRKSWDMEKTYSFESASGIRFDLTLEQIMSLYAYSKREQAHEHLLKGGFVFDGNTEVVETKNGIKRTYLMEDATAHNVSVDILADIIGKLTDQQKAYVDEMQDYLSTTMGNKGNDVSVELYGVKLFNEQFYFPLKSAGQYMERAKEANLKQEQGQINIVNSGFSKATTPKASNPVVLSGFMDVWASHVNEMSMYHSFVLPMEDFRRVYNYSSPNREGQPSVSVNQVIQNAHGAAATAYIDQLYRDLNGGAVSDPRETAFKTMVGKFKKAAVFASASVVIQQPSAVGRAFALINPKYFIGPRVDAKRHKLLWQEVKTYAPVAFIKEMGYFDTGVGRSAVDFLKAEEYSGLKEKAKAMVADADFRDEFIGKAPAMADELTWAAIWEAVKRETADKHPDMDVKSEEFLQTAGERFSEVIDKTQVYDSVLARSANMRSKSLFMNMATSFMAEPTTSINMIEDAVRMGKQGNKKAAAKTIAAVYTSVLINSALVSLVYAARDDDEDETFLEKYYSSLATEILEGMNLITYYPLLKDVWSLLQGWDIERADMSIIADLVGGFEKLVKAYSEDTAGMTNKQREQHEKNIVQGWWGTLESFASLLGLPLKNIRRDVNGARNLFSTIRTDMAGRNTTLSSLMDVVWGDIKDSVPVLGWMPSATKGDKLYGALARGEEIYAERLMSGYKNQDAANAAVRTAIKNRYLAGDIDSSTALKDLFLYAGVDAGDALWMVEEWDYKVANDGEYKKYGEFFDAVESGQNLDAVIKKYTDNGVDMDTLRGQITTHFRPLYVEMSASQKANIKDYIVHAYEQCGVRRSDAEDKLHDWDIEAQYGYGYGELDDAYRSGELSREEFRQAMIDNGTFPEKADRAIATYDWMRDNAEYGLEYSDAQKYAHPIDNYGYSLEDVGLDPYVYLDYKERKRDCLGTDDDNDGKADNGTLRADIFEMIDSLPINNNQKDALAAISYSMKSINKYAPWH